MSGVGQTLADHDGDLHQGKVSEGVRDLQQEADGEQVEAGMCQAGAGGGLGPETLGDHARQESGGKSFGVESSC